VPEEAWVEKIKNLEDRVTVLECHKNICKHPLTDDDWVFNGDDEVQVTICRICGDEV
jgi:hypothetical protein